MMLFGRAIERDIQRLTQDLGDLRERTATSFELGNLAGGNGGEPSLQTQVRQFKRESIEQVQRACESLRHIEEALKNPNPGSTSQYVISLIISLQSIQDEIEDFQKQLMPIDTEMRQNTSIPKDSLPLQINSPSKVALVWLQNKLLPLFRQILRTAWRLAANLLPPAKLVVRGDMSTGILGPAKAGLEIDFQVGPPRRPDLLSVAEQQ